MSDAAVRTKIRTAQGELAFQHYFVRDRCTPVVSGFRFEGVARAEPSPVLRGALDDTTLRAVVVCPSNPFVSVDPILALPGVEDSLGALRAPVVAVSPIVGGAALKGPAAKMMGELGLPVTTVEVARHYSSRGVVDGFVVDEEDASSAAAVEALGIAVRVLPTVMSTLDDRERLAREVLAFASDLARSRTP
jgi:LPPG:FO 2-phospho-L-lactate transferase